MSGSKPSLWLVVPVHGRPEITRVCLEQKQAAVHELTGRGINATVLVVGQDENVDTARELGFQVLARPNVLPRKLNDAFEHAVRHGATHVSFVGSDDWLHPDFLADLPAPGKVRTSKWIAVVAPTGDRLVVLDIPGAPGNASWIVSVDLLEQSANRPFQPETNRSGMDGMLKMSLIPAIPKNRQERRRYYSERGGKFIDIFEQRNDDMLRMVDFKGNGAQLTPFSRFSGRRSRIRLDVLSPWERLATRYPHYLVERMQATYANGHA